MIRSVEYVNGLFVYGYQNNLKIKMFVSVNAYCTQPLLGGVRNNSHSVSVAELNSLSVSHKIFAQVTLYNTNFNHIEPLFILLNLPTFFPSIF